MIGIMVFDVKEQFQSVVGVCFLDKNIKVFDFVSETDDECIEVSKNVGDVDGDGGVGVGLDDEIQVDDD